jgi:pre-mRNA-splicing factor 18
MEERLEDSSRKRKYTELAQDGDETTKGEVDQEEALPCETNEAIIRRLKSYGQPIRLFGETDKQRSERLRLIESKRIIEDDKIGQRNEYMLAIQELTKRDEKTDETEKGGDKDDAAEDDHVPSAMLLDPITPEGLRKEPEKTRALLALFLKRLLKEWERDMEARPDEEKRSSQGRMATVLQKQAKESLRPFFKQLKRTQLAADILPNLVTMGHALQNRRYNDANAGYLKIAIGNAPWPIGVTMVGIHERSAREKISSSQVAHALNDEATRKWLQALKRLMTFCENKYPTSGKIN